MTSSKLHNAGRSPVAFTVAEMVLMGRFPYALVYREVSDVEIEIVAVAHLKRRAGYWTGR